MRARLLFVMIATGCAVSAATACSTPDVAAEMEAKKTTQASSVTIEMFDKAGTSLGSCSGTLISKDLVLTAGHCVAGAAKWKVDSRAADARSESTRAVSPWKAFGSKLSHPDHSDVGVLVLSTPIELDKYPSLATSKLSDRSSVVRFGRPSSSAAEPASTTISVSSARAAGFRLSYTSKIDEGGFLDTGGAIIDPGTGKIHGVVSGVGTDSGLLHIARVDNFAKWIARAASCGAATTVRTYGDNGSSGSSGTSGGYGGSSGWGGGGGDWGGYGGDGEKIDGGVSSSSSSGGAAGSDAGTTGGGSSGSGTPGGGGTNGSGTTGGAGGGDTSGSGSSCPGVPTCEGSDCPGKSGPGSSGSSGSDGTTGSSGSSGSGGGSSGSSGASGSSGSSGSPGTKGGGSKGDEVCPGPPSCPEPDSQQCSGAACGGCGGVAGCVDATIDYGSCASCGSSSGTGTLPVIR